METQTSLTSEHKHKLQLCFNLYATTKTVKKPPKSRLNANGVREVTPSQPEITTSIDEPQFRRLFQQAGIVMHEKTLKHIFSQVCKAKGVGLTFDELCRMIQQQNGGSDSEEELWQLFQSYDRKNRGYFDYDDYFYVCQGIGKKLSEAQIRTAFQKIDLEQNGMVSFGSFVKIMKGKQ